MVRSRATRLGRAGFLLPVLLATACGALNAPLAFAKLQSRSSALDVEPILPLGSGFDAR
jgi:hypothetical protein